jgi:hypothetical protein
MGAPRAARGGARIINSRCCMMWAVKVYDVRVATDEPRASSTANRPAMKEAVRQLDQRRPRRARRRTPRTYQAAAASRATPTPIGNGPCCQAVRIVCRSIGGAEPMDMPDMPDMPALREVTW